jgi:hypothetical protein
MVERSLCMREVMGSIPIISTNKANGVVAQMVEYLLSKRKVEGSIPSDSNPILGIAQLEEHQTVMET